MTLSEILQQSEGRLREAGIHSPLFDAQLLIGHALRLDRAAMLTQTSRSLSDAETDVIHLMIARRATREPAARIMGEREFWSLPFGLNEATLEPRPDSETLVEAALKALRDQSSQRILDLGTGTGCLLLALLHELPNATGLGIDIVARAVKQAEANAKRLDLDTQARFQTGDWLDGIAETFDAIISNPPYIPAHEIPALMPEVREHDPLRALDGGADGLDIYRRLAPRIAEHLKPSGFVIFEVGMGQAASVAELCCKAGLSGIEIFKDFGGVERCVIAYQARATGFFIIGSE